MAATGTIVNSQLGLQASASGDKMKRYIYEDFRGGGAAYASGTPFGAPTGTAGDVNYWQTDKNIFQYHVIGTQTILAPTRVATGLDITQDLTNNDGVEWTTGCEEPANTVVSARSKATFTVGTDAPFFFSLTFKLTDVSGSDAAIMGWRKSEAYQADFNDYNDLAGIGNVSGAITLETILANAATTATNTTNTWVDAATHTLSVIVDSDGSLPTYTGNSARSGSNVGKVYYEIDGVKPTTTAAFQFASGAVLIPFFYFINDTDVAESTIVSEWECGFVAAKNTTQLASQA